MGGVGAVSAPQGGRRTPEEGEGGAIDNLRTAMEGMNVGRYEMEEGGVVEVEQDDMEVEGGGGVLALESTRLLTQEEEPGGTTLVYFCNGFNEQSQISMLWMVRHLCPAVERFVFNFHRHWVHLLLCKPGDAPVIILIRDRFTQGDLPLVVLYGITLVTLIEDLREADSTLIYPCMPTMRRSVGWQGRVWHNSNF